jgi:fatty acid desaturase
METVSRSIALEHEDSRGLLRFAADRRSLVLAAAHFVLIAGAFIGAPGGVWAVSLVLVLAYSSFVQLISGHNAMHSPLFYRRGLNRAWQMILSMTFCYPVSAFVPVHNLSHHMHLQTPKDVLRTTEVRHRSNLLNLLHYIWLAAVHIHLLNAVYVAAMRRRRQVWFAQVRNEIATVVVFIAVLIAISPPRFLLFVLLPSVIGQLMIFGFGYVQHDGCDPHSEHNNARNFHGRLFNWLIFDNGYHTIHHLHAGLHWSQARVAHQQEIAPHIHPALELRSVLAYLWVTYLWPGRRTHYAGGAVALPPERTKRELWIPKSALGAGAATGAVEG